MCPFGLREGGWQLHFLDRLCRLHVLAGEASGSGVRRWGRNMPDCSPPHPSGVCPSRGSVVPQVLLAAGQQDPTRAAVASPQYGAFRARVSVDDSFRRCGGAPGVLSSTARRPTGRGQWLFPSWCGGRLSRDSQVGLCGSSRPCWWVIQMDESQGQFLVHPAMATALFTWQYHSVLSHPFLSSSPAAYRF